MSGEQLTKKLSLSYRVKKALVRVLLLTFATAFETLSRFLPELQQELSEWEEGRILTLGVLPRGPYISLRYAGGRIYYLGPVLKDFTLAIFFKNLDAIILAFSGRIGAHTAFVQHRAILHGGVDQAMQVARAMVMVQKYLLPAVILKKIFKRPPRFTPTQLVYKTRLMATIAVGMAKNLWK